jgi:hypothetical protein
MICVINAPLSSAEVFTIVLIDDEVWVCDLGPAWCIQLYLPWIDGFFARSEPWAKPAVRRAQFLGDDIAFRGKTGNGHIPYLPASRQQNRRKLLPTLGFEHRRADIGERDKEFDTEDLESLPHDLQGFQLAPHFAIRFASGDSWLGPNKSNSGYATTRCDPVNILFPTIFRLSALGRWQIPSTCSRGRFSR